MIALRPLAQLDPDLVAQNVALVVAAVQEENPHLYLTRGVFAELLAYYNGVLGAQGQANIADYWAARSLAALADDPSADPDLVDDVLSNFRVTRLPGVASAGEVTVVVSDDVTVTVAKGSVWQANGRNFLASDVFTAKAEAAQVAAPGDRLLTRTADGNWSFTIGVVADRPGSAYSVRKDTVVAPLMVPPRYVTSYAASDFSAGRDAETNQDLLTRVRQGLAATGLGGGADSEATLRGVPDFERVSALSVVGMGMPEMLRDRHGVFPVSGGGRVDWYVRTQPQVRRQLLTKRATLVSAGQGGGVWQLSVARVDAPGFYELANVRPVEAGDASGGLQILSDARAADLTGPGWVPDVSPSSAEWAFTAFQTAVVQFLDPQTPAGSAAGLQSDYQLEAIGLPQIGDIQDYFSRDGVRPAAYDLLVKAPVPCFVQLRLTVYKSSGQADPDLAAIKAALCAVVNGVGFVGALYASALQSAAHAYLLGGQTVSSIDLFSRLRYPDGSNRYLRSTEVLRVPAEPARMVSPRTVQFFAAPEDVVVSVVTAVPSAQ
jgi:hypothetical protein